jgi:glycosyltransferase involved in cell wall biosynthesis
VNILIIHQSFPSQFVHLAPALQRRGHAVQGLGQYRSKHLPDINVPTWWYSYDKPAVTTDEADLRPEDEDGDADDTASQTPTGSAWGTPNHRGETVLRFLEPYARAGYAPDLILGHVAWGELLFLRHLWPNAKIIGYCEFVTREGSPLTGFDPEFPKDTISAYTHGISSEHHARYMMHACDQILTPTPWQASTFPPDLRAKTTIQHDGVDCAFSSPQTGRALTLPDGHTIRDGDEVITFASRNLEPLRGYHIFMRALPDVLAARPNLRVIIAGANRRGYGAAPPPPFSWRDLMLFEVGGQIDMTRLHYTAKLEHQDYTDLLRISRVHTYLTYPFVLSWSMIEALSIGAVVIGSRTPPVEDVIRHGENGLLVDFFDHKALARQIIDVLERPDAYQPLRQAARQTALDHYDAATVCVPRLIDLIETAGART